MSRAEQEVAARFTADITEHELEVLRDDGLYKHLRFRRPETIMFSFDLVTWPGYLSMVGDMGHYVFSRERDMLPFFEASGGKINPHYWSEKLQAYCQPPRKFSEDVFRERLEEVLLEQDWETGVAPYEGLAKDAVRRELTGRFVAHEYEARELLSELEEDDVVSETWEWDLTDYDHRFLWCCHAIVWGIARYREASAVVA